MHHDQMKRLVAKALSNGARRKSAMRIEWDLSGNCTAPRTRELHVRPGADKESEAGKFISSVRQLWPDAEMISTNIAHDDTGRTKSRSIVVSKVTAIPLTLAMDLRCRKCDRCLALRQMSWAMRAKAETAASRRTWFGTLTLRPDEHVRFTSQARVNLARQGIDFETLPFGEQFTERHKAIGPEITQYIKRVRKESGALLRQLCVAEHHKSGLPHYHMLVHEHDEIGVQHRILSGQWKLGFEKWRLVGQPSEAAYLCKYLAKASVARVRASRAYGTYGLNPIAAERRRGAPDRPRPRAVPAPGPGGLTLELENGLSQACRC